MSLWDYLHAHPTGGAWLIVGMCFIAICAAGALGAGRGKE